MRVIIAFFVQVFRFLIRYAFPCQGDTWVDALYEFLCNEQEGYGKMMYEVLQYY
ncbi:hypothetical protein J45TS6_29810 [Paenibacillus sp. J45TS6]|nr:hypothetical protein J45TS6_29810 [Paenibacillus sp. J45TS6]